VRLIPSREQLSYLETLGVYPEKYSGMPKTARTKADRNASGETTSGLVWTTLIAIAIIVGAILLAVQLSHGHTLDNLPNAMPIGQLSSQTGAQTTVGVEHTSIQSTEHLEAVRAFDDAVHQATERLVVYLVLISLGFLLLRFLIQRYLLYVTLTTFFRYMVWSDQRQDNPSDAGADDLFASTKTVIQPPPHRPGPLVMVAPERMLSALKQCLTRHRSARSVPEIPSAAWSLGFATHPGNVRSENQDYGVAFSYQGRDVAIIADGMGGLRHGREASYLAVQAAAMAVIARLTDPLKRRSARPERIARVALRQAHLALAAEADRLCVQEIDDGLRTTLIIVISHGSQVGYAYVGDGGGWLIHTDGEVESFLHPQKHENTLNVLAASLGPVLQGSPVSGSLERALGDVIVVCSDGIADRIDANTFLHNVLSAGKQAGGDLQSLTAQVVNDLAAAKDDAGFICDDNLTIGIIGTGDRPLFLSADRGTIDEPRRPEANSSEG
jgi:serine/threonine protein phosphatase PrpC